MLKVENVYKIIIILKIALSAFLIYIKYELSEFVVGISSVLCKMYLCNYNNSLRENLVIMLSKTTDTPYFI